MWTKQTMQALLDAKPNAVWRAVIAIHALQTADEQAAKTTTDANGVGFGAFDAEFLSDIAVKLKRGWSMSDKQLAICTRKMKRYHRQLCLIANDNDQHKAEAVEIMAYAAEIGHQAA